ncbi:MAG: para-aminobenzoate synthetase / 4-amino-4-deoxychorismate lyase [Acidimicrobiaceae bacterium]|jgi:para-aminobenzoate synthetase/4-amino-4-deoxychorismate lyase|nr:para-aminobenzoate synthetase / 4-amino-4-deoxychorismate lyase [Acidimicrobiaceae bacterium]
MPAARFDNLADPEQGFRLAGYRGEIVAWRPDEVGPAIAAAERAAAGKLWAAGFVSYEAAPGLDPSLSVHAADGPEGHAPPLVWFGLFERREAVAPLEARDGPAPAPTAPANPEGAAGWSLDSDPTEHRDQVDRIRAHIGAGDIYQLNLTNQWHAAAPPDPWELYRRLALGQRPAYAAFIDTGRHVVASASPELFFCWRGDLLTCRPMKGTAARGRWTGEDTAVATALEESAKDRAENVMIVDLVRNDVGRLAQYGTVNVPGLFNLERYPTVWQLTSSVSATTRPGTTLVSIFQALFPCGSVTGAPKRRSMDLISVVEGRPRGVYCGAVGFVGPDEARFNVAIRTAVVDRHSGRAVYGSGGGIVWDSEPEREFAEALSKAAILFTPTEDFDLIETMAFVPGAGLRNRERHLRRLAESAAYFDFRYAAAEGAERLDEILGAQLDPARVRLSLSRHGRLKVEITPYAEPADRAPVRLAIDHEPVKSDDIWLFHKTSRRQRYGAARARHPDADDAVGVNERGEVTETTVANLAVRIAGRWLTPPLDSGCLPGVGRACALDDGTLLESPITVADLRGAEEIAVLSSLRGWRRAVLAFEES